MELILRIVDFTRHDLYRFNGRDFASHVEVSTCRLTTSAANTMIPSTPLVTLFGGLVTLFGGTPPPLPPLVNNVTQMGGKARVNTTALENSNC